MSEEPGTPPPDGGDPGGGPPPPAPPAGFQNPLLGRQPAGGAPPPEAPPSPPSPLEGIPEWASAFQPEVQELIAGRKYQDVGDLANAYYHANKKLGTNPDRLVEKPSDMNDPEAMQDFYTKLGRPETAEVYTAIQEGEDPSNEYLKTKVGTKAHELGILPDQWNGLLSAFNEAGAEGLGELQAKQDLVDQAEDAQLRQDWGNKYDENIQKINEFAQALQLPPEVLEAVREKMGVKGGLTWALNASGMFGEHSMEFGGGDSPGGGQGGEFMDAQSARSLYDRRLADPEFVKRRNDNDPEAVAEIDRLMEIMSRDPSQGGRRTVFT